jgi:hypothetical protein
MGYVHDVAQFVFADLGERGEHAERERVREKAERVSAGHDYAVLGRHVRGSPRSPRTRSCPIGTSEFVQSQSKARHTLHSPMWLVIVTPPGSRRREGSATPSRSRGRAGGRRVPGGEGVDDEREHNTAPAEPSVVVVRLHRRRRRDDHAELEGTA